MTTVTRTVEASKELIELGEAISGVVGDVKHALDDGWQPGADLPAILVSAVTRLGTGLQGVQDIPAEVQADKKAAAMAVALPLIDAIFRVVERSSMPSSW
jgi:hypothetical protein